MPLGRACKWLVTLRRWSHRLTAHNSVSSCLVRCISCACLPWAQGVLQGRHATGAAQRSACQRAGTLPPLRTGRVHVPAACHPPRMTWHRPMCATLPAQMTCIPVHMKPACSHSSYCAWICSMAVQSAACKCARAQTGEEQHEHCHSACAGFEQAGDAAEAAAVKAAHHNGHLATVCSTITPQSLVCWGWSTQQQAIDAECCRCPSHTICISLASFNDCIVCLKGVAAVQSSLLLPKSGRWFSGLDSLTDARAAPSSPSRRGIGGTSLTRPSGCTSSKAILHRCIANATVSDIQCACGSVSQFT